MYLIGTDEAGYGPNLGPLVISATAWRLPPAMAAEGLYDALDGAISRDPVAADDHRAPMADSKRLYSSGDSWEQLELGLLPALHIIARPASTWRTAWRSLASDALAQLDAEHWNDAFDMPAPRAACGARIATICERLQSALAAAAVKLTAVQARPVFPAEFNALVDDLGNKSTVLSHVTLALARDVVATCTDNEPIIIHCDKHGGRNAYAALLQHFFPDYFIEVIVEGKAKSVYRFGPRERRVEFRFVAKGDNFLPAALASMSCKYLRELAMHAFNQFWQRHVPGLAATAGYPEDAKRFRQEIAAMQRKLNIADDVLWRKR